MLDVLIEFGLNVVTNVVSGVITYIIIKRFL